MDFYIIFHDSNTFDLDADVYMKDQYSICSDILVNSFVVISQTKLTLTDRLEHFTPNDSIF